MTTRTALQFGLVAVALPFVAADRAHAQQRGNLGQQLERQVMYNLGNSLTGQPPAGYGNGYGYSPYPNGPYGYPDGPYTYSAMRPAWGQPGYLPPPQQQQPWQAAPQPGMAAYGPARPGPGIRPGARRFQLPAQFNGQAAGSAVAYGGANYIVNGDGTMSPAPGPMVSASAPRYQLPPRFLGSAGGTTIQYGGRNYTVNGDGTMTPL